MNNLTNTVSIDRPSPVAVTTRAGAAGASLASHRSRFNREYRQRIVLALVVSAGFHGAFLFGFREAPAPVAAAANVDTEELITQVFLHEEEPPPPPPAAERTVQSDAADDSGDTAQASLPEPVSSIAVPDISIVLTPSAPVPPKPGELNWTVPKSQARDSIGRNAGEEIFRLSDLDRKPELIYQTQPVYPPELLNAKLKGVVVVQFIVNSQGQVTDPKVVSAPHPDLATAVTKAVRKWKFRAGMKNGRAVNTDMELPVRFSLDS